MKIWWCQEHQASYQDEPNPDPPTWGCWYTADMADAAADCRMVPMRLIPDNAENLIHGVLRSWNYDLNDYAIQKCAAEVVAALDGETP